MELQAYLFCIISNQNEYKKRCFYQNPILFLLRKSMSNLSSRSIIHIFLISAFLSLAPFAAVDIYLVYYTPEQVSLCPLITDLSISLNLWVQIDGYTRIGVIGITILFSILSCQWIKRHNLVVCESIILRIYYLFLIGWCVVGGIIFWGTAWTQYQAFCDNIFGYYMWAVLIASFLLAFFNFILAGLRSDYREEVQTLIITHRETEMSRK